MARTKQGDTVPSRMHLMNVYSAVFSCPVAKNTQLYYMSNEPGPWRLLPLPSFLLYFPSQALSAPAKLATRGRRANRHGVQAEAQRGEGWWCDNTALWMNRGTYVRWREGQGGEGATTGLLPCGWVVVSRVAEERTERIVRWITQANTRRGDNRTSRRTRFPFH
jgi:hypothetical protein